MNYKSCIAVLAVSLTSCATSPEKISATYVSPLTYKDHDCDQIAMEMEHVSRRTGELYRNLKKEADADSWQMGVGLVLFWPTLFFLEGGDGPEATEYAHLKGQYDALHSNAVQRKCLMAALPPSPDEVVKAEQAKAKQAEAETENIAEPLH